MSQLVGNFGVNGAAYSSIGTGILILTVSVGSLWRKLHFSTIDLRTGYDYGWFRRWTRVGAYSALDSLIRNVVYLVVVIRTMNLLEEQASAMRRGI